MNIALEVTAAANPGGSGIARYTRRLVEELVALSPQTGDRLALGCRLSRYKYRETLQALPPLERFWIQEPLWPPFPRWQVVHGTDARVPNWRHAARVATVHDVTSLLFEGYSTPAFREKKRAAYRHLARICQRIITISHSTKHDLLRYVDYPEDQVVVTHLAADAAYRPHTPEEVAPVLARLGLPPRYLLFVGDISERKNVIGMVQGYAQSRLAGEIPLVLAGKFSYGTSTIQAAIQPQVDAGNIRLTGYVPDTDMPALYAGAQAFLFPTFYEGFGLPVVEAMACGVPTLCSNSGAVPEVAAGHAVLVDPHSISEIAQGIEKALAMTPQARQAAAQHARQFTWEKTARETRQVYLDAQ